MAPPSRISFPSSRRCLSALPPVAALIALLLSIGCTTTLCRATADVNTLPLRVVRHQNSTTLDRWIAMNMQEFEHQKTVTLQGEQEAGGAGLDVEVEKAEKQRRIITVRQDGKGDFRTIAGAVKSIPAGTRRRTVIKIGPGVYKEKVEVEKTKPFVTFYGDPASNPTITFGGTAAVYGTWDSATVTVKSKYFVAYNVIFKNSAPMPKFGASGAQAVALRISADMAAFYNCKFYGYQDTLCDDTGKHYFKDCLIRGTVDYIFGNGRSIYEDCHIESVAQSMGVTAIVAQGRQKVTDEGGFSFTHCNITGTGSAYLSRAWKDSSRVVFSYTYMGNVIHPKGWDDKGVPDRDQTVFYAEYKCSGPGSATADRVRYGRVLTDSQAQPFISMNFIKASTWLVSTPKL